MKVYPEDIIPLLLVGLLADAWLARLTRGKQDDEWLADAA